MNIFKRIMCVLLSACVLGAVVSCSKNEPDDTHKPDESEPVVTKQGDDDTEPDAEPESESDGVVETEPVREFKEVLPAAVEVMDSPISLADYPNDLGEYARTLFNKVRKEMTKEGSGIAYEFLGKKQIAFLWPTSVLIEAASALYECNPDDEDLRGYYVQLLDKFLPRYQSKSAGKYRAYASSVSDGDRYYDDNEWIVIEFIRAHRLLGNEDYLTYAKELAEYVYSGWVSSSGGIRWIEGGDSCNTCSNGPAAVLSCMLYEETGEEYYLEWAEKIYGWTRDKLLANDGTYYDNVKIVGGAVDKNKFAYNTGTMIVSGVMLYRITGDVEYLNQARASAKGGDGAFFYKVGNRCSVKNDHPWFNSWLLEGFIELFKTDIEGEWTADYINDFYKALDVAIKRAGEGIYAAKSWNSKADAEIELIHQAGTVRAMAQMARLIQVYAK